MMIDLRHLYFYSDSFQYKSDWLVKVGFKTAENQYQLDFGIDLPPPTGFVNKTNSPYVFSFMVSNLVGI